MSVVVTACVGSRCIHLLCWGQCEREIGLLREINFEHGQLQGGVGILVVGVRTAAHVGVVVRVGGGGRIVVVERCA